MVGLFLRLVASIPDTIAGNLGRLNLRRTAEVMGPPGCADSQKETDIPCPLPLFFMGGAWGKVCIQTQRKQTKDKRMPEPHQRQPGESIKQHSLRRAREREEGRQRPLLPPFEHMTLAEWEEIVKRSEERFKK